MALITPNVIFLFSFATLSVYTYVYVCTLIIKIYIIIYIYNIYLCGVQFSSENKKYHTSDCIECYNGTEQSYDFDLSCRYFSDWRIFSIVAVLSPECHPGVDETASHAEIESYEIQPREYVIAADDHSQIGHADILQTSDYGCSQSRIVKCTQNDAVRQYKSHDTRQCELNYEHEIGPVPESLSFLYVSGVPGDGKGRHYHEQRVVIHEAVFAELLGVQFFLHINTVGSSEYIAQQNEDVSLKIESKIVGSCDYSADDHGVDAELYGCAGLDAEYIELGYHRHQYTESSQSCEHRQAQLFCAAQTEYHVADVDHRQRPYLHES